MPTAKTAISLDSILLEKTEKLAKETGNSRSGVIAIALQKYFDELEEQQLLNSLNEVYEDSDLSELDSGFVETAKDYFANNVLSTEAEQW